MEHPENAREWLDEIKNRADRWVIETTLSERDWEGHRIRVEQEDVLSDP
jgi:hypothetical protein